MSYILGKGQGNRFFFLLLHLPSHTVPFCRMMWITPHHSSITYAARA